MTNFSGTITEQSEKLQEEVIEVITNEELKFKFIHNYQQNHPMNLLLN